MRRSTAASRGRASWSWTRKRCSGPSCKSCRTSAVRVTRVPGRQPPESLRPLRPRLQVPREGRARLFLRANLGPVRSRPAQGIPQGGFERLALCLPKGLLLEGLAQETLRPLEPHHWGHEGRLRPEQPEVGVFADEPDLAKRVFLRRGQGEPTGQAKSGAPLHGNPQLPELREDEVQELRRPDGPIGRVFGAGLVAGDAEVGITRKLWNRRDQTISTFRALLSNLWYEGVLF